MANKLDEWRHVKTALQGVPAGTTVAVSATGPDGSRSFGHNHDLAFPSASTIKIVLLAALAREVDAGRLRLEDLVTITASQRVGGSGVLQGMTTPDLRLSLADHALLMISISDNTASNVLIDAIGEEEIRNTVHHMGLTNTALNRRFIGKTPPRNSPDNLTSAHDLVRVLTEIDHGTAASPKLCTWMLGTLAAQQFTDRLGRSLAAGVAFAGKSGSLDGLFHDCGLLVSGRGTAVVAVLTQGFTDKHEAATLIGQIGAAVVNDLELA